MSNELNFEFHGISLRQIANEIDHVFGFPSEWQADLDSDEGCYEYQGKVVVCAHALGVLCEQLDAGPGDLSHVVRYVMAHLKTHHYQELHPTYAKAYVEDPRPYELEADLAAGWICANAQLPNSFRILQMAPRFNDFKRLKLMSSGTNEQRGSDYVYPWPAERDLAFVRGGRQWALGRISLSHSPGIRLGLPDEAFHEFMLEAPIFVNNQWQRLVPDTERAESPSIQVVPTQDKAFATT
jgi:hypothetical protein